MATQSGIGASSDLLDIWANALTEKDIRIIQIQIRDEKLIPSNQLPPSSTEADDFSLLIPLAERAVPSYFLYKLDSSDEWVFYSYVPDDSPVRSKMIYASTRATLLRSLGDRFPTTIFATTKSDLTYESYLSHLTHLSSDAPLTTREQEMADTRKAEQQAESEAIPVEQRSVFGTTGTVGLAWSEEALEAVKNLKEDETEGDKILQLEIDLKKEILILSPSQPTTFGLPPSEPCFTFFRHSGSIVYIYSCPPSSSVKSRLVYSSSSRGIAFTATDRLGLPVAKKIETSSPEEVDIAYVAAELGLAAGTADLTPASPPAAPKAFARPARPGRRA